MSPLDKFLEKELHKEINSLFMKQPPTPPEPRKVYGDGSPVKSETIWFRVFGWGLQLKPPSSKPMFSERYEYVKPLIKFRGWRLFILKPNK